MGKPRAPKSFSNVVAPHFVANVEPVSLVPSRGNRRRADDQTLESVGHLSHLKSL
jgi:hypothetical protein